MSSTCLLKLGGDVPHVEWQARAALEMLLVRVDSVRESRAGVNACDPRRALQSTRSCAAQSAEVWIKHFYCDFAEFRWEMQSIHGAVASPAAGSGRGVDPDPVVIRKLALEA